MATKALISPARQTDLESAAGCTSSLTHRMVRSRLESNWIAAGAAARRRGHPGAALPIKARVKKKKKSAFFLCISKTNHPGGEIAPPLQA